MKSEKNDQPFVVAVEATRMPMIFVDAVADDQPIIYANASFLRMMGYTNQNEIIGKPFLATISGLESAAPINLKESDDKIRRPIHYVNAVRSNGETFTAALLIAPINDAEDKTYQYFISFVDISEHGDLSESQQKRLRDVYQNTPGFIATTIGPDHQITFANQAYRTLVGPRDLIGLSVKDAFPELHDQGFMQLLDNVYATKRSFSGSRVPILLAREPDHPLEQRFINFIYQPIIDATGQVTGLFCEGSDVTDAEQKEADLRLLQAQFVELGRLNAMGTMAATLAHELNQPLAAISNYAAGCLTLLQNGRPNEQVTEGLQAIAMASDRAGHTIRRLRDMTKRTAPITERFNLAECLIDAVHLMKAGSFCNIEIGPNSSGNGSIIADKIQVQQVIVNLLKNACEAAVSVGRGSVQASISKANKEVKMSVVDDGPGVSSDKQENLFSWSESEKTDGMGMGLSISRTIIENHGGKIWLESTSGRGSKFAFTLPATG